MVHQVRSATERLATLGALVWLDAAVGDDVCLQLVGPVERLRATYE